MRIAKIPAEVVEAKVLESLSIQTGTVPVSVMGKTFPK